MPNPSSRAKLTTGQVGKLDKGDLPRSQAKLVVLGSARPYDLRFGDVGNQEEN